MRYIIYQETLIDFKEHVFTFLGSFVGIGLIGFLNSQHLKAHDNMFLIGSFGASSVLIYGIINSPFSQPRNLVVVGIACQSMPDDGGVICNPDGLIRQING